MVKYNGIRHEFNGRFDNKTNYCQYPSHSIGKKEHIGLEIKKNSIKAL